MVDPTELSYGDRDDTDPLPTALTDMQIMDPKEEQSKDAPRWLASISALMEEGWRAVYSDGTGRAGHADAAAHIQERRGGPPRTQGTYLGTKSNVADAERAGMLTALRMTNDQDQVTTLTDSIAAKQMAINLCKGDPPRSGIESQPKAAIRNRQHIDTGISWARIHIGITGNEMADNVFDGDPAHYREPAQFRNAVI